MSTPAVAPVGVDAVGPLPHGHTARRLTWKFLPREVRELIEVRLGSPVARADSQDAGFTPGFASVLTGENGDRLFVKAASVAAQPAFAGAYREEARVLEALDGGIPSPRLLWVHDEGWVVLGFEAIDGRAPRRPWRSAELGRALDLAEEVAAGTTSVPGALELEPVWVDVPQLLTGWNDVVADWPHREEAAALAQALPAVAGADRFVHFDLRDDNILLARDGRALACDWNWPALGPAWLDLVVLLISAHGDGHDADRMLAERGLTRDVEPDDIDALLAAMCGFMLSCRDKPSPPTSPHLRHHNSWYAEASWSWLAARRGWS